MRSVLTLARWLTQVRRSLGSSAVQARRERAVRRLRAHDTAADPWLAEERVLLSAPVIMLSVPSVTYTENAEPVTLDPMVTVSDPDADLIISGQVKIVDFESTQDQLTFTPQFGITGSYDNMTGILSLSGLATAGNYATVLSSVKYQNLTDAPSDLTRTIEFRITDTEPATSAAATLTLNLISVIDTPTDINLSVDEDTPTAPIVLMSNPVNDPSVTHFQITGITNGTLIRASDSSVINDGDFIAAGEGVIFQGNLNYFGMAEFQFQAAVGDTVADLGGDPATAHITVNPVADTPDDVTVIVDEDTLSGPIELVVNPVDDPSVTHFQITGITNGTLYLNDETTEVNDGDFITVAEASSLKFKGNPDYFGPAEFLFQASLNGNASGLGGGIATATITINSVADTPANVMATADEDTLSGPIQLLVNPVDDPSVTHFQITGITNGILYQADGVTVISDGEFITLAQAMAGVTYKANADYFGPAEFKFQAAVGNTPADLGGALATASITVNPIADTPDDVTVIVDEDTLSGPIVLTPNAVDLLSVTHFQITGITNGTLYLNDGVTVVNNGDFVTAAQAALGLKYQGNLNYFGPAEFKFQAAIGPTVGDLGGALATASITVVSVNDNPTITVPGAQTTNEGSVLALPGIVIDDVDVAGNLLTVEFQTTGPTASYTLGTTAGITFLNGTTNGGSMPLEIQGTLADLQAALATLSVQPHDNGLLNLTLVITDELNGSNQATIPITVNNVAPTPMVTGNTTGVEGTAINLTASSTDPANQPTTPTDNDSVTYNWQVLRNGVLYTTGAGTNFVLTPNNEGTYQVFLTASDEDGGSDTTVHTITVANVAPTATINATDIDGQFYTYVDIAVDDPGNDGISVLIVWGDINPADFLNDPFLVGETATTRTFPTISHRYLTAPNPQDPLAPVTITFFISDGTDTVIQQVVVQVTEQGIPAGGVYITPEPEQIVLPAPPNVVVSPLILTQPAQQQVRNEEIVSREDTLTDDEARLVLHVVGPTGVEGPAVILPDGLLKNLRGLFAKLPDGHYRVYLVQGESRRLVIEVFVRQGRAIDPAEADQGTQERPPQVQPAAPVEPDRLMQAERVANLLCKLEAAPPRNQASLNLDATTDQNRLAEQVGYFVAAEPIPVTPISEPETPENAAPAGVLGLAAAGVVAGERWRRTARRQRAAAVTPGPDSAEKIEKTWSRSARRARQWKPR